VRTKWWKKAVAPGGSSPGATNSYSDNSGDGDMPPYSGNSNFDQQKNINRQTSQDDWGGYIDVRLSGDDKLLFSTWYESNEGDVFNWLNDALAAGLKLGMMYDGENQCYVASLNGRGVTTSEKRFTLTARANTFDEAFALLCYKHYVALEGDWGNWKPSNKRKQDWG